MKIRTACLLLLAAWTLSACGTFLLPHPSTNPDQRYWNERNMDYPYSGDHVPPGFRDPPPPPPPPPPPAKE